MNNYITLDGNKYATLQRSWRPVQPKGSSARVTVNGGLDVTYGALTLNTWTGEIRADVVSRGAGWGTVATLRVTLAKLVGVTLIDHYGASYTVHQIGQYLENSIQPVWDGNSNVIEFSVKLVGV